MSVLKGRGLLRSIGPFWADLSDKGQWGIECDRRDGKHFLAIVEATSFPQTDGDLAAAIADVLNSACGFPKGSKP